VKLNNRAVNNFIVDIIPGTHKGKEDKPSYFKLYEGPMTGGAYQRNILYHVGGGNPRFYEEGKNFRVPEAALAKDADTDFNIYYSAGDPSVSQSVLDKKQSEGVDSHSLAVDPLFVDPENGDFRFHPDSPALKLGIVPLDVSKAGLLKD
jgi:hypothetical protein